MRTKRAVRLQLKTEVCPRLPMKVGGRGEGGRDRVGALHAILGRRRRRHSSNRLWCCGCCTERRTFRGGRTALRIIRSLFGLCPSALLSLCLSGRLTDRQHCSVQAQRRVLAVIAILHSRPLRLRVEQHGGSRPSPLPPPPRRTGVPRCPPATEFAPAAAAGASPFPLRPPLRAPPPPPPTRRRRRTS